MTICTVIKWHELNSMNLTYFFQREAYDKPISSTKRIFYILALGDWSLTCKSAILSQAVLSYCCDNVNQMYELLLILIYK